jgi:hypothetical protein
MEAISRTVRLVGATPILFDRYAGDNNERLPVEKKVYLSANGELCLPAINLMSFLSAQNTESAPKRVCGKRWLTVAKSAQSFVQIEPFEIPFTRKGKPLTPANAGLTVHFAVARMRKGSLAIPNPKERPMLALPWELEFTLRLFETPELREEMLKKLFVDGGAAIGLGTFRGVFGKFTVEKWA